MPLKPSEIDVTIEIGSDDRIVPAKIVFRNPSPQKAYLYKRLAPAETLKKNLLRITGPSGPVRYKGPIMKLAAPTPADFIELAPGTSLECKVKLGESYDFPKGAATYRVRYFAVNSSPTGNQLRRLESPEVAFELPA